jgi:predicted ester cyclase
MHGYGPANQNPRALKPVGVTGSGELSCLITWGRKPMANDHAKLIVRRFIDTVVNTGDVDRATEFVRPDILDETRRHVYGVRSTYPDPHVVVGQQIVEGELVMTRVTATGTHKGSHHGITPTNKTIVIEGVNLDRVRNGKIVDHWGAANTLEALIAIGALPLPTVNQ